jgi:hypothetical protein
MKSCLIAKSGLCKVHEDRLFLWHKKKYGIMDLLDFAELYE